MTAQISDRFRFKGDAYSLIGLNGGDLASREQFGMEAEMIHTACYRGFYATYVFTEEALYLRVSLVTCYKRLPRHSVSTWIWNRTA
jgi:hypothetical protein